MERTTGNVFAALGFPDADEMARKSDLVIAISDAMKRKRLSQSAAAEIVRMDQPTLSKLLRGRHSSVSIGKLTEMLNALGRDVTIVVSDPPEGETRPARTLVEVR